MFLEFSELLLRVVLAVLLGAVVGYDRELNEKAAGFRTHILVCLGAAIFAMVSLTPDSADQMRVAAGVVTGIGFLGAGSIFRSKDRVRGLTTAADLLVMAGIGLAIGIGYYMLAMLSTIAMFIVLLVGRKIDGIILEKKALLEKSSHAQGKGRG